jgi:opacity protein-like surface antigen
MKTKRKLIVSIISLCLYSVAYAQAEYNVIPISVQMLNIAPEARGTAMGDAGVASTPDISSQHWNPAKYAFMDSKSGASLSITPWLRQLINDINLFYAVGYYKLDQRNTVSASLRYFSLGDLIFYDEEGYEQGTAKPNEFAIDAAYSIKLADYISGGVALRFIHSDLGYQNLDDEGTAGNAFAADLSFYFKKKIAIDRNNADVMAGINISNIGTKVSYDDGVTNEYLPANLRIGAGFWYEMDRYNKIGATVDFNKLLVPTPDYRGVQTDEDGNPEDTYEKKQAYYDESVIGSIFKSFGDAPGGGKEELQEIDICGGIEYIYNDMVFARLGYHYNHENKGNLKYCTAGLGLKYQMFNIDASYVFTVGQANSNSALANTIRITLGFDLGKILR